MKSLRNTDLVLRGEREREGEGISELYSTEFKIRSNERFVVINAARKNNLCRLTT